MELLLLFAKATSLPRRVRKIIAHECNIAFANYYCQSLWQKIVIEKKSGRERGAESERKVIFIENSLFALSSSGGEREREEKRWKFMNVSIFWLPQSTAAAAATAPEINHYVYVPSSLNCE
jgi:hypothetical protein